MAREERLHRDQIQANKLIATAGIAFDFINQIPGGVTSDSDLSIPELERLIADLNANLKQFRMAHVELAAIQKGQYDKEEEVKGVKADVKNKIYGIQQVIGNKREYQGNLAMQEREIESKSKRVLADQTIREINLRCDGLKQRFVENLDSLPDSQLLDLNKELYQLDGDASKLLDKVTEFSRYVRLTEINGD